MRVNTAPATTSGTLDLPTFDMKIDEGALGKLMGMMSSIYSDGFGSVTREYLANARDSHVEASNPDPVELELPNTFEPNMVIRDRGVGLTLDDIINVYASYGLSTKDSDDDAIGGFGIGAKSAFAIASNFTVEATKDGMRAVVIFNKASDRGVPTVRVISHEPTDEPDGVTVKIPVKQSVSDDPIADAKRILRTWEPGTVLLNGEQPPSVFDDGVLDFGDGLYLPPKQVAVDGSRSNLTLVMGGIGYHVQHWDLYRMTDGLDRNHHWPNQELVAVVPIGSVDIAPDREGVQDSAKTKAEINRIHELFQTNAGKALRELVNEADTALDAMRAYSGIDTKLQKLVTDDNGKVPWNGEELSPTILLSKIEDETRYARIVFDWGEAKTKNDDRPGIGISTAMTTSGVVLV